MGVDVGVGVVVIGMNVGVGVGVYAGWNIERLIGTVLGVLLAPGADMVIEAL